MTWVLIGYFPKRRVTRSAWISPYAEHPSAEFPVPAPVEEICSVSSCIAMRPDRQVDAATLNDFSGYNSPIAAWQAVPREMRSAFDVFAYQIAPELYRDGRAELLELQPLGVTPIAGSFSRLGYDAVELSDGQCLGCSPLSCNGEAAHVNVNPYCLVATRDEGRRLARSFSVSKPEPGPYCVVEVWRQSVQRPT